MQLLQHFKELTVNPKNAQELKGLILQLAIQGKLTANWRTENPNIEPASELLQKTLKKKEEQSKNQKKKKERALPSLTEDETPFGIARTWVWTRLGEVGTTNVGLTYKPAHKNDSGVPVLRSSNVQEGELCLKDLVRVNTDYREKDIIKEGDLLICARNGSRRLVGKCTIIGQIDEIMVFGAFMAIFRSDFNPYLQLFIQSPQYRSKLDGVETTTINQITQGNLKATAVPLPPLEEQKEIVKVVATLFKEVEQLEQLTLERIALKEDFVISALNQLTTNNTKQEWTFLQDHFKSFFNQTTNIKKLRETVLQLAVQGKLTADWRSRHPELVSGSHHASELLKSIQEEKTQLISDKKIKKEKSLPKITKEEIPHELPEGWVWCRLQDLVNVGTGSTPATSNSSYYGGEIPWYTSSATNDLFAKESEKLITEKALKETNCKVFPKETLIIAMYGQGKTRGQISELVIPGATNQAVAAMVFYKTSKDFKEYIKYFFRKIYDEIRLLAEGGAQPNLNVGKIKNTILPLPPLEEQKAIVQKVNGLMGFCDKLELEVQQSQKQSEQLMQSVLREVFEKKKAFKYEV
ncbi:type I restriction enzyme, S subunit [Lutibacter agarilyticus]|uniref:Type I restriction enzyme, S subunit n=1 Tax=Lutibacter agarilyticus TaxID=1109740 RepID=A0A238XG63_9FLAO|nr:restriction endonuclease subunit S [Lutibacter agarilyticus]SNR57995.1 type I restriction enzyme, S subunit [Lutibacter agarilyticus]